MSDLTTTNSTEWLHFTNRERRKIVVVNISLGILLEHIINELDISRSSECRNREHLSHSSLKEC
jgi:hypothetical protein